MRGAREWVTLYYKLLRAYVSYDISFGRCTDAMAYTSVQDPLRAVCCWCRRVVLPGQLLLAKVCKLRELPIFTFVNKMDRPSLSPFDLLDQIEREFGMRMAPVLWPIGDGERFKVRGEEIQHDATFLAWLIYILCCGSS